MDPEPVTSFPPDDSAFDDLTPDDGADDALDLGSLAPPPGSPARGSHRIGAVVRDLLEAVGLAVILFVGLQLLVQNTVVKGVSMVPNYTSDQRLLVSKLTYRLREPQRGDVIVFHAPGLTAEDFIKRIIGLPGETVSMRNGITYINGKPLPEPWSPVPDLTPFGPFTVPPGDYFVMGDNRPNSNDSRTWQVGGEALTRDRIVGPVWISVWPPAAWGVARADGPGPVHETAAAARQ
jgi:signal peptidase I